MSKTEFSFPSNVLSFLVPISEASITQRTQVMVLATPSHSCLSFNPSPSPVISTSQIHPFPSILGRPLQFMPLLTSSQVSWPPYCATSPPAMAEAASVALRKPATVSLKPPTLPQFGPSLPFQSHLRSLPHVCSFPKFTHVCSVLFLTCLFLLMSFPVINVLLFLSFPLTSSFSYFKS